MKNDFVYKQLLNRRACDGVKFFKWSRRRCDCRILEGLNSLAGLTSFEKRRARQALHGGCPAGAAQERAPARATVLSGGAWFSGGWHRGGRGWDIRRCGFVGRLPSVLQQRLQAAVLERG